MVSAPALDVVLSTSAQSATEYHARRLARRFPFRPCDEPDIQGGLTLCWVQRAADFDPDRASLPTYIDRVVRSAAAGVLRSQLRLKRAAGNSALSLDSTRAAGSDETTCLGEQLAETDRCRRTGNGVHDNVHDVDLADAVDHVLSILPPELRVIAMHLREDSRPLVVARRLGLTRGQMGRRIRRLRTYFGSEDFEDFRGQLGRKRRK